VNPRLVSPGSPDEPSDLLAGREAHKARARQARGRGTREGPVPRQATRKARSGATLAAPDGDREISGCARGLFWLQKSTSGAGSTPSGMGLAPTPHAREGNLPARFCLVQRGFCFAQRGEEASWPARGGNVAGSVESRRVHAAASLRVRTAAMPCGRAGIPTRDPSSMEGVLVRRGLLPLTRRRGEAGLAARRTQSSALSSEGAVAVSLGSRQRAPEATSRARFAAENAATGRHGAEELPIEAPPGPRGALFDASARSSGSARARRTVVGDGRSWRVAVKRRSTRGSAGGPTTEGGSVSQPRAGPARGSPGAAHARESDGPCWVHVFVSRLQKSERGIFPPVRSARPQRAGQARG